MIILLKVFDVFVVFYQLFCYSVDVNGVAKGEWEVITPAVWEISRPGHNWTNQQERYTAIMNILQWIKFGRYLFTIKLIILNHLKF